MEDRRKSAKMDDVLTANQLDLIVEKCIGDAHTNWQLVGTEMRPATEGLAGFVGDHFRLTLRVRVEDQTMCIPLFVKCVPLDNAAKITFIEDNRFFSREMTVYNLIEEMETGPPNPCVAKALLSNKQVLVMPDLAPEGYSARDQVKTLDLPHVLVALRSVARFHAGIADVETRRGHTLHRAYSFMEEHSQILVEKNFIDSPWIHTAAKLTANIIQKLSDKHKDVYPDLERDIRREYVAGCEDLTESANTLNVVIHKDLWVNNILFKYEDGALTNAILVDFQCVRYAPPAFDVMMFLYLTTSRSFREQHEAAVLRHYFDLFMESSSVDTKLRMKGLGYDYEEFLRWADKARRFGMVGALVIFPFVLMNPIRASVFDDDSTYDRLMYEDRTEVVLAEAQRCPEYGHRQLEISEEFVERYLNA